MATLREYLNAKIKEKGSSLSAEKAKAGKYKSIAAAKKAGALYYTDKNGKVMAAVYAEDLKKPIKKSSAPTKSVRPKARPKRKTASQPKITTMMLDSPKMFAPSRSPTDQLVKDTKKALGNKKTRGDNLPKPRPTEIRLSTKNLNKFLRDPDSLTSKEKLRLKKTLKRAGIKIPKGL